MYSFLPFSIAYFSFSFVECNCERLSSSILVNIYCNIFYDGIKKTRKIYFLNYLPGKAQSMIKNNSQQYKKTNENFPFVFILSWVRQTPIYSVNFSIIFTHKVYDTHTQYMCLHRIIRNKVWNGTSVLITNFHLVFMYRRCILVPLKVFS